MKSEIQYLDLLSTVLDTGTRQANRTGIDTLMIPGAMLKFDLADGFPVLTTKFINFPGVVGEVLSFLRGYDNAADFRRLGCNWWDANANKNGSWLTNPARKGEDDLGRVYGVQWRHWQCSDGGEYDQVAQALADIMFNPSSRRIIINAWRPDELDKMALPPCHVLYQFLVNPKTKELHLCMYQRSCDLFLGVPMNIAGSALILSLFAKMTGLRARTFTHFLADAHIYVNHVDQVKLQLTRSAFPPPGLGITLTPELLKTYHNSPATIFRIPRSPPLQAGGLQVTSRHPRADGGVTWNPLISGMRWTTKTLTTVVCGCPKVTPSFGPWTPNYDYRPPVHQRRHHPVRR